MERPGPWGSVMLHHFRPAEITRCRHRRGGRADPFMLACRNCRRPLLAEDGCAICAPIKKHLVAVDEDEETKPSLAEVGSGIVADLQYARKLASGVMRDKAALAKDRLDATARILKIGNTASKVLEATRKLQTDGLAAVRNMSFLERAELFVSWYLQLPPPYKASLREQMDKHDAALNQPALPEAVE